MSDTTPLVTTPYHRSVRPVDQMRSEYHLGEMSNHPMIEHAHELFHRRMAFENFNLPGFDALLNALEEAHVAVPRDAQVSYELAHVLTQYRPDLRSLQKAQSLLEHIHLPTNEGLRFRLLRLQGMINVMLMHYTTSELAAVRPVPHRVNWAVYNRCPMVCMGCYNTFSPNQLSLDECKQIVLKLKAFGIRFITLSGGDPLLWPDLWEMIDYTRQHDLHIGIDTSAYTLTESQLKRLVGSISYLGIPLDGSDHQTQNVFRKSSTSVLENTQRILRLCEKYQMPTKVNTVIHRQNFHQLEAIGDFLRPYTCVRDWSVFQWWPLRSTPELYRNMAIDLDFFEKMTADLPGKYPNMRVRVRSVRSRAFTHFFIQNSGVITTFGSYYQEEIILGHMLRDEIADILRSPAIRWDSPKFHDVERFQGE